VLSVLETLGLFPLITVLQFPHLSIVFFGLTGDVDSIGGVEEEEAAAAG